VRQVSGIQHHLAVGQDGRGLAEVNHGGGEQADAGMTMLFVIPGEKLLTEGAAVLEQPKRSGNSGRYFMVRKWLFE